MRARPLIVDVLADRLQDLLGERLIAVILGGSWSMDDFVEGESDLDLLVVVSDEFSRDDLTRLSALHETLLLTEPEAMLLEGDYAPLAWLVPTGTTQPVPFFRRGRLQPHNELMLSADNIANLRRDGIAVFGAPPTEVLPEVTADEVRAAVREMLLDEPVVPSEREAAQEILDLLRSLCAIETGLPSTKSDGVRWALEHVSSRWHEVVLRSDEIRRGAPTNEEQTTLRRALTDMRAELLLA